MLFYWSVNARGAPLPGSPERRAGLERQVWGSALLCLEGIRHSVARGRAVRSYFSA